MSARPAERPVTKEAHEVEDEQREEKHRKQRGEGEDEDRRRAAGEREVVEHLAGEHENENDENEIEHDEAEQTGERRPGFASRRHGPPPTVAIRHGLWRRASDMSTERTLSPGTKTIGS